METEVVTIQEPVSTKTNVEEAPGGVILDHSSMKVDNEITSHDCGNNTIPGEADVVNGSGNKETEEAEREKGEAMKTISVEEENKIVKEKASETEKDEQSSIFVHEPESFNRNIEDAKIILSDVTLEKEKEDDIIEKPEEVSVEKAVIEEDQTDTKHSPEQEKEIGNISKVLVDTTTVKVDENDIEKSLNSAHEEIPIKTDEVNEEKYSSSAETSVNETEAEHKATVSVEEISRNGENIVNETVPEEETATDGESIHDIETTKSVLLEVKKEEEEAEVKTDAEPLIKTVVEEDNILNNEETTAHESESLKENEEPVEEIKNSDDAEKMTSEVTVDKEKEEVITQNTEEEQESVRVIETQTIQEEEIESKASLDHEEEKDKSSKDTEDTEEHEHELVRDKPQGETFVTEAESVDTSTVQEAEILKTNINETEAHSTMGGEEEGQETKENTKTSQDLKEDTEQEETEIVKTIISSDEVRSSDVQVEEFGEHIEPSSLEIKDESHGREESVEVETKETVQEEITEEKHENLHDVASSESVKSQDNEPETALVTDTESQEKFVETPSDLALNVDKEELKDEKIKEEQRGLDSNGAEEEQVDQNRTDDTEESPVAKLVVLPDVEESVEQMQTPSIESASEISEETSKTIDVKIEEKPEEEVTLHQEGQEKGSYGLETKEETVSVPKSIELGEKSQEEKSVTDINPLQEESSVPNEQEKETKLETHEPTNEEVKADEVIEVSSTLPSKELEGETVVEAEKIENIKENEEEQAADKIQKSVESHSSLPSSLEEKEHETVSEKIKDEKMEDEPIVQIKSEDNTTKSPERQEDFSESIEETKVVQAEQTRDTEKFSMDQSQPEEQVKEAYSRDEQEKEVSRNSENIVNETYALHSGEAEEEEETATNGESPLHDVETAKRVLVEVEKDTEESEMKTDAEPSLDAIEKEGIETLKTVVEDAKIINNEETTAYESTSLKGDDHQEENAESVEAIKNSDDAEQNREMEEDITQKTEKIQESSMVIQTPTTQGEEIESETSLELKEEVDQSSKDIEEHDHVLGRDIPQCETLEAEAIEPKEDTKPSLDKEDEEQEVTETAKTVIFSDEVRPSDQVDVQVEELSEHIEPRSSEIKDESHGREESVEVKTKDIVQEESTEEKHENRLDVPSTESEKYQDNEPETSLVASTESPEKFEDIPSDLAINVDKEELKDEKINVDQVDGTQIMEEQRDLDPNETKAYQIDQKRTDETEESPVIKLVGLPDVESVDQTQTPSPESPSEVPEETSKPVDENIEEETVAVQESKELGEQAHEERSLIDLNPLQEESSQPNEQEKETKLEKHEPANEEVKSDEVIEVSFASLSKEFVQAEKIENIEDNEEDQAEDKIQKSVETFEAHNSLPSSLEEKEHKTISEKIEDEKVKEEEPIFQIKSEDDTTKSHERPEDFSESVEETTVVQAEQTIDSEPSLTEKCSMDQSHPEEKVKEACSRDEQEKEISKNSEDFENETYASHNAEAAEEEEETATNGESPLHDVETTKSVLLKVEKEAEMKTEEIESVKTVVEDAKIVDNEETAAHESKNLQGDTHEEENAEPVETIKNSDDAEEISSEVTLDREMEEDITQKTEKVQESSMIIGTPTTQGEGIKAKTSLELKEEVDQSSKDTEEHQLVVGRDIPQFETLEIEAVDTSTVQEAAILKTLETNINETEEVHSAIGGAEESQEIKEDTETSMDLKVDKEQKEAETLKTVIFSDEVRPSDQVDAQAEELGEDTELCSSEIKDESQGREESVEVESKETVQDKNTEEKNVNLLDVQPGESEKCHENELETTLVSKIESQEKSDEFLLDLTLKDELKDEKTKADQVDETQTMEVLRGLDLNEPEAEQIDQNRNEETEESPVEKLVAVEDSGLDETTQNQTFLDVESVEKLHKPSLETSSELSEETSKTVDEKIEDKAKEEVTLHQEGQEDGSYGLETKEETVSVPNEQETETKLQEKNEPTNEEVSNDQHSLVEETSDEVIQVSSALPPEEREGSVVEAEKIEDKKVDEEEQVADKDLKILATVETVEPHSSLPSSSEEQEHGSVSKKTDDEKVKEAEAMGDISEKGLEIAETTDVSLPSVDQTKDIKAFDEEIHITSVAVPLDEQEKVTSTEKEETKENETAEVKKGDEEITTITSKTSENVCIQQEEFEKIEAPKLEESQEDKSLEISETIKAVEATSDQTLPIETSDADKTHSSELVSEEKDQTPKQVEEIHEEETKEAYKLQAEEILPTEIIPRESSDQALIYLLASKESEDDVTETKDTQEERSVSVETEESVGETKPKEPEDEHVETPASPIILEKNYNETLIAEAKKGDEDINETETTLALDTSGNSKTSENLCIKEDEFKNLEAPKLEESKEDKSQEILEIAEAIEATGNQTELVSRLDDQTPRHVEEIHEEDAREERKFEAIGDQSIPVETSQAYQTPSSDLASELDDQITKQVEEVHEEDTKEEHKLQVAVDQILPVETSEADQTSEILGEEIKETHKVQAEDIVPRDSFGEAPVSMLASGEPVTPQEGIYDTQEARHVTAETEEKVETSNKLTEVEDENTKKTDIEVAEHEDENSSNLPIVEILKGLHTTLETEREVNDSASSGENLIIEPADQEQKKGDAEVESNEKDSASDIIEELNLQEEYKEEVKVQDDIRREFEVNVEEKLQEETREIAECKEEVPADLSLTEVLPVVKILTPSSPLPSEEQEHVMSEEKQEEHEPQQDVNASTSEKISLQEEQKEKKAETHENDKEEDQIVDIKEEKKNEEEQDEKLWDSAATRDIEEIFSSEVKDDKEVNSVLGREEDINEVVISEKQTTDPVGVITKAREAEHESNEEHVETQVILDDTKNNDDRDFSTEQALKDQEDEVSADKSVTKEAPVEKNQVPSSALLDDQDLSVKKPSEIIQPHQSPNQVEETSFEFKKTEEDKNEETGDALIVKENVQVQDQPKDFEASVTDKETSEQEQKSNDLKEDFGTNVKDEDEVRRDSHDSVVEPKEETGLIEEKKEVEHVKTELEDAIKHGVLIEEKNNTSEKIEHEAAKEISQEESKQTYDVKEEIREEEKETKQECFKKTDDATDFTQTETRDIESLSSVSKAKDKSEQKDDIPNQRTREIAVEVPKIAEEVHKKDGESKNKKDLLSKVKESEPTEKESARKLSNLIQKVKGTTKTEDATKEPHIEEEPKTEEDESEDGDHEHNKDDKTSPDSIVMVEAKDTVSIIKTHKKSQGILSGVGSKVKHSISKVKKVLTGKSSHTTKPSSPK